MKHHGARAAFHGSERFEVLSHLGAGGMGSVYGVLDRERGVRMALKTVGLADGQALLRFKREFRELHELQHPNLVRLGELIETEGEWFYTMELVDGVDLATYVTGNARADAVGSASRTAVALDSALISRAQTVEFPADGAHDAPEPHRFDEVRLRSALAQLADGLATLHEAHKVHRDLKPANILVDRSGRVVILDFGLVTDVSTGLQKTDVGAIGTLAYMAPEQASGRPVDARADWYSFGVILFEALTGQTPFEVGTLAALARKVSEDAPDPATLNANIPADLAQLCRELLRRDPAERPSARRILETLGVSREGGTPRALRSTATQLGDGPMVGRVEELAYLREQLDEVVAGRARSVILRGEIGIGKTHLVRHFLSDARGRFPKLLELRGRCAQYESLPFKGLDGVVDALSSHLSRLSKKEVEALVPENIEILARTFPVLRRVAAFGAPAPKDVRDPQEQRAVVFTALRRLLVRVVGSVPTVLFLDDAQWLDEDSATLLGEILRLPDPPPLLFLAAERVDAQAPEHESRIEAVGRQVDAQLRVIPRLSEAECTELAMRRLGDSGSTIETWARRIGAESHGHPLFVDELARHVELAGVGTSSAFTLEAAIEERLDLAAPEPTALLRCVTLAGAPIERRVLVTALGSSQGSVDRSLAVLETLRLVRSEGALPTSTVEPYHGVIAPTVLRHLDAAERVELHSRIAQAMEALPGTDLVDRARHWADAGQTRRAAECYAAAAEAAAAALAFDRTAELLRRSLALVPTDGPGLENRRLRLAQALANAGRGAISGEVYEEAAASARGAAAIELRRLSAEQFMLSGHLGRGIASFRGILSELGIRYPRMRWVSFLSIGWTRLLLVLRGYAFRERDASLVDPWDRLAVDVCRSVSLGLLHTDPIGGFDFQQRALVRALRLGEPERIAILLATEAGQKVSSNRRNRRACQTILERARTIAERAHGSYARGACAYAEGMSLYLMGEWRPALEVFQRAERIFRDECPNMPAELRTMQAAIVQCLWEAGEWKEVRERLSRAVKEAAERGDIFTEATFRAGFLQRTRCVDDTALAGIAEASRTMAGWTGEGFGVQQWLNVVHGAFAMDYADARGEGFERLDQSYRAARFSLLFGVQLMRAGFFHEYGVRAIHRALSHPEERAHLIKVALRCARRLDREDSPWTLARAQHVRGCAYAVAGDATRAATHLQLAMDDYDAAGMPGAAAAMRWAKGVVVGGARGEELVADARAYFVAQGVVDPERLAMALAPVKLVG